MLAERYGLLKKTHEGVLEAFTIDNQHQFENYEDDNEEFFSSSEKQFLLKELLDHVICEDDEIKFVPGFDRIKVYKNRPVCKLLCVFIFKFVTIAVRGTIFYYLKFLAVKQ